VDPREALEVCGLTQPSISPVPKTLASPRVAAGMWDAVKPHPPGRRVAAARRVKSRIEQTSHRLGCKIAPDISVGRAGSGRRSLRWNRQL